MYVPVAFGFGEAIEHAANVLVKRAAEGEVEPFTISHVSTVRRSLGWLDVLIRRVHPSRADSMDHDLLDRGDVSGRATFLRGMVYVRKLILLFCGTESWSTCCAGTSISRGLFCFRSSCAPWHGAFCPLRMKESGRQLT